MTTRSDRLTACFGTPAWAWIRDRLRRNLTNGRPIPQMCNLQNPDPSEWDAATALLGRPASHPGKTLRVPTADLEARLVRAGLCGSLREALETLDGPIHSRPAETRRANAIWDGLAAMFDAEIARWHALLTSQRPDLSALVLSLISLRSTPIQLDRAALRTLCQRDTGCAGELLANLSCVFDVLAGATPTDIPRSQLAASALGDSHALDPDKLLFRAMARLAQQTDVSPRDVWKCYRVLPEEVSSSVLVLNFRFSGSRLAEAINGFADMGEPCRLLLRHCNQLVPHLPQDTVVHVCENPTILEAAAIELGAACPPLICTEGQPSLACQKLLIACGEQSIQLYYHGDFDWGGVRIANYVRRIVPTIKPWRYQTDDYDRLDNGRPLEGLPVEADWDPLLRSAMATKGNAYHEEQLLVDLLADLRHSTTP
ncbi:MAG: TIGR02679 family protein [Lentisphaerae bacterium]|nr:TIGR02679 family protein [Lentisphaerota bacterium]